jgi:secondary thiamine-phosphate synthase enzyme
VALNTGLLRLRTEGELAIVDITDGVRRIAAGAGVSDGIVSVFVTGSTAAITTMEFEPGGVTDLRETLERLVPRDRAYHHNVRNYDDNAHSHLRASLLGPSETIPLVGGRLVLGTWQQLVLIELDDRPREREVHVQIAS